MKRMTLLAGLVATVFLAACAPAPQAEVPGRRVAFTDPLPPMRSFSAARVTPTVRSNGQLAADFMELAFEMESGRRLPRLTRFEGTVTVGVRGTAPPSLSADLSRLLTRLRSEAGIDIRLARAGEEPRLMIEVLPRRQIQRLVPQAACFVVPRVSSWEEFRRARRSGKVDWTTLERRDRAAVFLPGDVSPQETRDCMHEEIAQALGPLNDLYRLPDSVFNDDNFHTVLTGFDMLMLRVYYDRALVNGMTRAEVASRLPGILARLNPSGQRPAGRLPRQTPRAWIDAIETALGPRTTPEVRVVQAKRAVGIARDAGWTDNRRAFSLYALGRLTLGTEPELALAAFLEAAAIYRARPETQVQAAHVAMQLAAFSLSSGQAEATLRLIDENLPAVAAAENAALLSTLLLMKATALDVAGAGREAEAVRREALGWARYGFGTDAVVRARAAEIASLAPGTQLARVDTGR